MASNVVQKDLNDDLDFLKSFPLIHSRGLLGDSLDILIGKLLLSRVLVLPEEDLVEVHPHLVLLVEHDLRYMPLFAHDASKDKGFLHIETQAVQVSERSLWRNQ